MLLEILQEFRFSHPEAHVDNIGPPKTSVEQTPPQATFTVSFVNPSWDIQITNPQYVALQSSQQLSQAALQDRNRRFAGIVHQLQWFTDATFSGANDSNKFPTSAQTHYTPVKPSTTFWRIRSSFDGFNFNDWSPAKNS